DQEHALSHGGSNDSTEGTDHWNASRLLQLGILLSVRLAIQARRDEQLRRQLFALGVFHNRPDDLYAHLVGELDGIGVDFAVADGDLAFALAVEADDLDLLGLPRLL